MKQSGEQKYEAEKRMEERRSVAAGRRNAKVSGKGKAEGGKRERGAERKRAAAETEKEWKGKDYDIYEMKSDERNKMMLLSALFAGLCGYLYFHSLFAGGIFIFFSFFFLPVYKKLRAENQKQELRIQFRDFLYSVSASVNTGRSLDEALEDACEPMMMIYGQHASIVRELSHMIYVIRDTNGSAETLLKDFARRSHIEEIEEFVDVCTTYRKTGGDLASLIGKASEIITQNIELRSEKHVLLSQKKMESRILALMPPSVILLINLSSSDYLGIMYTTLEGHMIMALSFAATFGSFLWSFRLISFD